MIAQQDHNGASRTAGRGESADPLRDFLTTMAGFVVGGAPISMPGPPVMTVVHCSPTRVNPAIKRTVDSPPAFGNVPALAAGKGERSGGWRCSHRLMEDGKRLTGFD
jgi:hypothetical protein